MAPNIPTQPIVTQSLTECAIDGMSGAGPSGYECRSRDGDRVVAERVLGELLSVMFLPS